MPCTLLGAISAPLAAVAILLIGWVIALLLRQVRIKKVLQKLGTDHKLSNATGHGSNIEVIVSRVVFLGDFDCCGHWSAKCVESDQCQWAIQ